MSQSTAGGAWLTVSETADRLGVSPRAVQKRCHNGKLAARRITTAQGVKWEIDANALSAFKTQMDANQDAPEPANRTRTNEPTGRERTGEPANQVRTNDALHAQNGTNLDASQDANERTTGREPDASNHANEPGRIAELREEVKFLRSLLEARDRDAAELRAALREALRLAPKQLPTGAPDGSQDAPQAQSEPYAAAVNYDAVRATQSRKERRRDVVGLRGLLLRWLKAGE